VRTERLRLSEKKQIHWAQCAPPDDKVWDFVRERIERPDPWKG
jgi:hypothetical protein